MSTVLCPRLVALDPSVCTTTSCRASHTHEPAFCDPCKAVHAAVHAGIHLASIGHRLRVDGPVAPVRCVVCAPLPGPPQAQFLFVGPEHYVAHARTSAHRAKLSQLPPSRSKTKADFGLGLGRPGDQLPFMYTRSSSAGNPYSPPASRNVTPTPGAASRPGSSMSFNAGAGFGEAPPGPPPIALEPTEYVICALCHTVLPVPTSDVAPFVGSKQRNVSGGSDATVRARDDDDVGSVVTTTENDTEVRKSLVLANHMSTDTEHARRVKFPKFRAAYEKRIARERKDAGEDDGEEERPPVVDFASRFATANTSALTHSPDQLTLSSLSSSPSVDGLDDPSPPQASRSGGLFFHQHHRHRRTRSVDSQGPEPEPRVRYQRDDDFVMQRQRSRYETSSNGSSEHRAPIRVKTQPEPKPQAQPHGGVDPPAYVREHNLPITIPDHLLPFLSPITPSAVDPQEELERYGREPTSEYLQALPIRALSTPLRTTFMLEPDASESSTTPERPALLSIPEQPTPAESERVEASPSTSAHSRPYEPSPSPPPRLAFDDAGRVLKLGTFGWERQTGPMYDDLPKPSTIAPRLPLIGLSTLESAPAATPPPAPAPASVPAPSPKPVFVPKRASAPVPMPLPTLPDSDSDDAPEREEEPEHQVRKAEEKSVVSGSVGTVQVKRYTLNRNGTDDTAREPVREGLARSGLGRASQYTTLPARSSTQFTPGRSSVDFTPGRSSTLGPNRSSGALGLTTTASRPTASRTSTGEWAVLGSGSGSGQVRFDEFGARVASGPSFGGSRQPASLGARPSAASQPWLGTGSQNGSRSGTHVRIVRSPEALSSKSSEGKASPPYFNFKSKLQGDESDQSSPSEASQIIRAFDTPPLDLNLGTPEMLSPRRSSWTMNGNESSPEKSTTSKRSADHASRPSASSPARQSTSPPASRQSAPSPTPRSTRSPAAAAGPSRQYASPAPSRPFSPTLAWNGLTPASPHHSLGSTSRSPSLSSAGEDGVGELVGQKPFDEDAFLSDLKFGIARALGSGDVGVGGSRVTPSPPAPAPAMRPPRMSSPLARISTGTPPRSVSPARTGVSEYSVVGKTRRRVRPMGTSSVVGGGGGSVVGMSVVGAAWGWEGSVVGGEVESVVGGEEGSVVDGHDESVVEESVGREGSRRGSVVSSVLAGVYAAGEPDVIFPVEESPRAESVPSKAEASYGTTRDEVETPTGEGAETPRHAIAEATRDEIAETPTDDFGSLRPQAGSPASVTALRRRVRGQPQSVLSSRDGDSEAPSSVVSPLSPKLVSTLRAAGMHVDPQQPPSSDEVDAVVSRLAGMNIGGPTPRPSTPQRNEPLVTIERVDSVSGLTSPIAPPGAPSEAGSLFSRVVSPKPTPTKARLGAVRMSAQSTPVKSTTAAQGTPTRSVHPRKRPDSSLFAAAQIPAPASVGSTRPPAPEVAPESVFSSGANVRRSADPMQMPMPRGRSVFSRGPGSVVSGFSGASREPGGLLSRLQASRSGLPLVADAGQRGKVLRSLGAKKVPKKEQPAKVVSASSDDFDGGLTSSEEEDGGEDDEGSDAKTAAAEDDGLDHLTESIEGVQADPALQSPVVERPTRHEYGNAQEHASKLPSGEPIDQPLSVSPQMPAADPELLEPLEGEMTMPEEVLSLNPVICDACYAPMPLAKWTEHIAKAGHRRNAARHSQLVMEQSTHSNPPPPLDDARERWAEATRIQPRRARPSEYAFCDICAVFLLRGDLEHFQGKKHYRCVRAAALNDADELESVRGSVSDEEDGPSARAFRGAAAAPTRTLGHQVFQSLKRAAK